MRLIKFFLISIITLSSFNLHAQCYDSSAVAFFTATGITDTVQKKSINHLVVELKNAGLWTKMKAIYPFIGSTATTHKWNLKDPRDLDAAYRLTFYGTITHSSTGALPDGSSGYADTHMAANSSDISQNSAALSFYSRTNTNDAGSDFGTDYLANNYLDIRQGDNSVFGINSVYYGITNGLTTDARGLFTLSRTSSSVTVLYRNGTSIATVTDASTTPVSTNIKLFASELYTTPREFSNRECAFASISTGLVDSNATSLSTAVTNYIYNLANGGGAPTCDSTGGDTTHYSGNDTTWVHSGNNIYFNNGNVGIGTTNPTVKLAVVGTIKAYKVLVRTDWSDYVFDKSYKLPTLAEIEKFIKLHQHLQGIPSAKEIEKNGLDVGNGQSLLLKKIEELTLLLIKQNNTQENLKKIIKQQNKRIEILEKK